MALLHPTPAHSRRFSYDPGTKTLTAWASDLDRQLFGQVWDDACDEGLTVISGRTGRQMVFSVVHVQRDGEGDLQWWDLAPANRADQATGIKLRVYND